MQGSAQIESPKKLFEANFSHEAFLGVSRFTENFKLPWLHSQAEIEHSQVNPFKLSGGLVLIEKLKA
jgi:hypothetical protein